MKERMNRVSDQAKSPVVVANIVSQFLLSGYYLLAFRLPSHLPSREVPGSRRKPRRIRIKISRLLDSPASLGKQMNDKCFVYLDDLIVFERNVDDRNTMLIKVYATSREINLKLNPAKKAIIIPRPHSIIVRNIYQVQIK